MASSPKEQIQTILATFAGGSLEANARNLLNVLGYESSCIVNYYPQTAMKALQSKPLVLI